MKNLRSIIKPNRMEWLRQRYAYQMPTKGRGRCDFDEAVALDPTKNKKYLDWILRASVEGRLLREDHYKVPAALKELIRCAPMLKRDSFSTDLNRYTTIAELNSVLRPYEQEYSPAELSDKERAEVDAGTDYLFRSKDLLVVRLKTEKASCFWGRGTKWCTAAEISDNAFSQYTSNNCELFVFIYKGKKYQLASDGAFLDTGEPLESVTAFLDDSDCTFDDEIKREIFSKIPLQVLEKNPKLINLEWLSEQNDSLCRYAVSNNHWALQHVKNQTEELCLTAVRVNGWQLEYVINQTPEICLAAVKKQALAFQFVKEQTPELCLLAAQNNGRNLRFIKNQNTEMCLAAVMDNGENLKFVENKTPEICLAAVNQLGSALEHVTDQSPEVCLAAVQRNGFALKYVKNQTIDICLAAVKENGRALQFVENQTDEICLEAVRSKGYALKFVKNKTDEICLAAVRSDPLAIELIKNPSRAMMTIATQERLRIKATSIPF